MDPRLTLAHGSVAALSLEGLIEASEFRPVKPMRLAAARAAMRDAPDPSAQASSELLLGEAFDVLLGVNGFAFGQSRRDGYVGFVAQTALVEDVGPPTHRVSARSALAFAEPNIKAPEPRVVSRNSLVRVAAQEGRFAEVEGLGFVVEAQLLPVGVFERDIAAAAQVYLGAPYLWGGRSEAGLDCSGMVQQAMAACGRFCPRDSDMQRDLFPEISDEAPQRGDLVFWPGHVAMLLDPETMIHANAFHMQTAVEPLAAAIARIGTPSGWRRPS